MSDTREGKITMLAINAAMLVLGFAAGYWYAMKSAFEIVREGLR